MARRNRGSAPLAAVDPNDIEEGKEYKVTYSTSKQVVEADSEFDPDDLQGFEHKVYKESKSGKTVYKGKTEGEPDEEWLRQKWGVGQYTLFPVDMSGKQLTEYKKIVNIDTEDDDDDDDDDRWRDDWGGSSRLREAQEEILLKRLTGEYDDDRPRADSGDTVGRMFEMMQAREEKEAEYRRDQAIRKERAEEEERRRRWELEEKRERDEKERRERMEREERDRREREDRERRERIEREEANRKWQLEQQASDREFKAQLISSMAGLAGTVLPKLMEARSQPQVQSDPIKEKLLEFMMTKSLIQEKPKSDFRDRMEDLAMLKGLIESDKPDTKDDEEDSLLKLVGSVAPIVASMRGARGQQPDQQQMIQHQQAAYHQLSAPQGISGHTEQVLDQLIQTDPDLAKKLVAKLETHPDMQEKVLSEWMKANSE